MRTMPSINQFHRSLHPAAALLIPLVLALASSVPAQEQPAAAPAATVTREDIQARMSQIEASDTLDANTKASLLETYGQAQSELQTADDWRKRAQDSIALRESAPETIRDIEEQTAQPLPPPAALPNPDTTALDTMVAMLAESERKLDAANAALVAAQQEITARATRRTQLDTLIAEARSAIDRTRAMTPGASATPEEVEALRVFIAARVQALQAEIAAYNEELANFELRGRLLTRQQDLAQRELEIARRNVGPLRDLVAAERINDARRALADAQLAQREAADAPPAIRGVVEDIAAFNVEIASRRADEDGPQAKKARLESDASYVNAELQRLSDEQARIEAREKAIGLTEAVGTLLRTYRENLPPRRELVANLRLRKKAIDVALLEQIELNEARGDMPINRRVDEILDAVATDTNASPAQLNQYSADLTALLSTQRNLLDVLISEHELYLSTLFSLNSAEKQLLTQRDEFADYINQRVLWIASAKVISFEDLRSSADALRWFADWRQWADAGATLGRDLTDAPLPNSLALVLALSMFMLYPRIKKRMAVLADQAQRRTASNYLWTLETLAYTILLSAFLPLIVYYVGWRLSVSLTAGDFARVVGSALTVVAIFYATFEFGRRALAPRGLGDIHFEWPAEATTAARRTLTWIMPIGLPILFVLAVLDAQESPVWRESAGRLAFFVLMIVWAIFGHRLTNKNAPGITIYFPLSIPGNRSRIRRILYLLSAGAPIALAIAAMLGYFDTAQRLAIRVHFTLFFFFVVSCCVGLAMRALLLTRRRVAIEQAKKKRAEMREAQKKAAEAGDAAPSTPDFQEPEIDLAQIDVQTTRLTRSASILALSIGLWFIWVDFIPALRVLDEITIGETTAPLRAAAELPMRHSDEPGEAAAPAAGGGESTSAAPESPDSATTDLSPSTNLVGAVEALTYADLLVAVIVLYLTISAVRNLPGLLEIAVLQRIKMAAAERYAIKTVLGYIIAVIGTIAVLNILGIRWERMQWLVAALGLGIGFGLQEIVANFISGLIILFERPVRLGDTVTVGNVSGTVTRIQIRATTITDWERKDLIVPNKEFVTGQVINWSLSDAILRTTIAIGVDYSSDTRKVRDILVRVANANSRVLKEPEPMVVFTEFGASTLNFEVRVFVANIVELLPCRDELHHAIIEALRDAGIEIAFNQTDIHIRSLPATFTSGGAPVPKDLEKQ